MKRNNVVEQIDYAYIVEVRIVIHCPHKPRRQVHHINYDNRNESSIVETVPTSVSSNPTLSNKFEVLSQLEEESNE